MIALRAPSVPAGAVRSAVSRGWSSGLAWLAATPGRLARAAKAHWLFSILFVAGAAGRALATEAYRPALLYFDSYWYIYDRVKLEPQGQDPIGYALFVNAAEGLANMFTLAVLQHLVGLAMGVCVYALLRRFGAPKLLAAVAAAPILLDAYQWQVEEYILSDSIFLAMVAGAMLLLVWRRKVGAKTAAAAGLILGLSVIMRTIGEVTILPALAFVLVAGAVKWRARLRSAGAMLAAFLLPLVAYAVYMHGFTGQYSISTNGSLMLYGRAATVAECAQMPADLKKLCPTGTVAQREALGPDYFDNEPQSPASTLNLKPGPAATALEHRFAVYVIEHRTWPFLVEVGKDFMALFLSPRQNVADGTPISRWQFFTVYPVWSDGLLPGPYLAGIGEQQPSVNVGTAQVLLDYQLNGGYTPGYYFSAALLAALAGLAGLTRRARRSPVRPACFLFTATGLVLLLGSDLFEFSWRYQLPALIFLPVGGAMGVMALFGWDGSKRRREPLTPYPDAVDAAAAADFEERGGMGGEPGEIAVVIAAYNEEGSIGAVLDGLPSECMGMAVTPLVVVDGATDDTARISVEHGAPTVVAPRNRGQGAALRLGYNLAQQAGAKYIVTTDADGQYDATRLKELLAPLVDGDADFTTGSRVLGSHQTDDAVRQLGCRVFAAVVSVLMRTRVTDTSFGLRAMRSDVPVALTLAQPQYQSSELLIGILAHGYRVVEVPMTIARRDAGETKKGNNLVYGWRYAKVVFGTWWRERGTPRRATSELYLPAGVSSAPRLANTTPSNSANLMTKTMP